MGNNTYTNGGADGLWSTDANWSDLSKPTVGDTAYLDGTSDANLTVDENAAADGFVTTAGYDGNVDFGDARSHAWGSAGMVFDHTGNLDLGIGTTHTCSGDFDVQHVGNIITVGTSTVILTGTCAWRGKAGVTSNHNLTIAAGAVVDGSGTGAYPYISGTVDVWGSFTNTLSAQTPILTANASLHIQSGGVIAGFLRFDFTASGYGLLTLDGTLSAQVVIQNPSDGSVWAAGTWGGLVWFIHSSNYVQRVASLSSGSYVFASLKLSRTGFGITGHDLVLDLGTNNPSVTITGDWTIDIGLTGGITITPSSNLLVLQGDLIDEITGAGTFNPGGQNVLFSDTAAQNVDGCGGTWGDIEEDKTAGTVTLTGTLTCGSFTGTDGDMDLNGQTLTASGAVDLASGFTLADPVGSTVDCDTFTANGVDLIGSATWYLNAASSGTIHNATITNCDASGGAEIDATDGCTDGGGNFNINFGALATGAVEQEFVHPACAYQFVR